MRMNVELINARVFFAEDAIPGNQRGAHADWMIGTLKFPDFRSEGAHRGFEIEYSHGEFRGSVSGDGCVINNWSTGLILDKVDVDRKNIPNIDDTGNYAYGYNNQNSRAIECLGDTQSLGTTAADFERGTT